MKPQVLRVVMTLLSITASALADNCANRVNPTSTPDGDVCPAGTTLTDRNGVEKCC